MLINKGIVRKDLNFDFVGLRAGKLIKKKGRYSLVEKLAS